MEWEEEVPKFLEGYEFLESLNVFCSLIEDCKDVVDPAIVLEHQILKSDESNPSVQGKFSSDTNALYFEPLYRE